MDKFTSFLQSRVHVLERVVEGGDVSDTLDMLCRDTEKIDPAVYCSVLTYDQNAGCLHHVSGPSLPDYYNEAIDGLQVGQGVGSCGTAAFTGERVIVEDVLSHPYWEAFLDLAKKVGFRSCWSQPIYSKNKTVLGTFAMYYDEVRHPTEEELQLIQAQAGLASLVIERKQTEEELQTSEKRYRNVVENAGDAIIIHDLQGKIVDVNQSACSSTGYSRSELLSMSVADIEKGTKIEDLEGLWSHAEDGHVQFPITLEGTHSRKDGKTFPVEVRLGKLSVGKQNLFIAMARNIAERKNAEKTLRTSEEKFRKFYTIVPDVFMFSNLETGHCIDVNDGFCRVTGYSRDDVIGRNSTDLGLWERKSERFKFVSTLIEEGVVSNFAANFRRKDGSLWPGIISASLVELGEHPYMLTSTKDVSEIRRTELEATNANQAKSEFLANMSHELRTPLNAILGFSGAMQNEMFGTLNEKYMEYVTYINNSGQHLLQLINDILDVSAIEAGKLELIEESLDIGKIIETTMVMVNGRADMENVHLISNVDGDLPMLYADKRRLMQIFLNLLSNAIKFTPPDGEITLTASLNDENAHIFTVTDTGIGMGKEGLTKALANFGQVDGGLDRKHEGTGLGLPLTKALMELHGGILDIKSEEGEGTSVTLTFPKERVVLNVC